MKKLLEKLPQILGRLYSWLVVLIGWVFFSVESNSGIVQYLEAMFGLNGAGLYNREALFLGLEYVILFVMAVIAATPLFHKLAVRMENSGKGYTIACYRVFEKLIPAVLLLASIAYIVDATYNPFLYFRF